MKITIDEKMCAKHKMTLSECLLALAFRSAKDDDIHNMLNREILVRQSGQYLVTQHWSDVLDEILCDSNGNLDDERITSLAKKIQDAFPSGYKTDEKTGAKYYHRSNKVAISQSLKRFITHYGDYPDEDIIDATKRYVASFRGNYGYPFQMANYFVCKDNRKKGGDITSTLATYLDNKEGEGEEANTSDDWKRYARN